MTHVLYAHITLRRVFISPAHPRQITVKQNHTYQIIKNETHDWSQRLFMYNINIIFQSTQPIFNKFGKKINKIRIVHWSNEIYSKFGILNFIVVFNFSNFNGNRHCLIVSHDVSPLVTYTWKRFENSKLCVWVCVSKIKSFFVHVPIIRISSKLHPIIFCQITIFFL